ncbi:hypothetical protein SDC9_40192 [bioreactor metagenome]|uniref:Phage head morphogenesis domain-containing protein n=1 Tax=bioreactor metagenome TaxID=1076179 RepID=A0A644VRL0_9ZZZZ
MADTYWETLAALSEEAAQRVAADRLKYVQELYREASKRMKTEIDALFAQIIDSGAESVTRTQLWQYNKYKAILQQIDVDAGAIRTAQQKAVEQTIRKVFEDTIGTTMDALSGVGRWTYQTNAVIDQYLKTPWSGELYSKRIWTNTQKMASDLKGHMEDMLIRGKTPAAVKKQLMADYGVSYEMADRLVMTETSNAYNTAALESYRAAGVKQVRYVPGPDEGRCERCRTYSLENKGIYDIDDAPHIPVHPRCRCRWVAVVDVEGRTKQIREKMLSDLKAEGATMPSVQFGGYSGAIIFEDSPAAIAHAQQYYAAIRKMTADIPRISKNTGWKKRNVAAVKQHVFLDEHLIDGQMQRFDPSYEIAQSWQRLIDGRNIQEQDLVLLNHELMELQLMREGLPFEQAHAQASKAFDFGRYVKYSE